MEPTPHADRVESAGFAYPPFVPSPTARANRRRLLVFLGVFVAAAAVGLGYTFARPAEYRATARVQITPAGEAPRVEPAPGTADGSPKPFLTEVEVLASRPVLAEVVARLGAGGEALTALRSRPDRGREVLARRGAGRRDERRGDRRAGRTAGAPGVGREQRDRRLSGAPGGCLQKRVRRVARAGRRGGRSGSKRASSPNGATSRPSARGTTSCRSSGRRTRCSGASEGARQPRSTPRTTVSPSRRARLRSLTESAAAGKGVVRARDNPTLANLEQRASQGREELRETRAYLHARLPGDGSEGEGVAHAARRTGAADQGPARSEPAGGGAGSRGRSGSRARSGAADPAADGGRPPGGRPVHDALQRVQVAAGGSRAAREGSSRCGRATGEAGGDGARPHAHGTRCSRRRRYRARPGGRSICAMRG